ncbi:FtsX-like permease family protein [Nocardioides sp. SYSU DS0651]|uniref:FtsX-like permease family protein n=1 Tax=Nocardioides sp. SYSU DS0651 TaxID=3415955 RepID=UPI003F4C7A70
MSARAAGWRVALRLARREALRRKGQTALMLVLICLPVVAVTAATVVWRTSDVSSVESIERRMGAADALVTTDTVARVEQHFDPEVGRSWLTDQVVAPAGPATLRAVLGEDRSLVPLHQQSLEFETDEGLGALETFAVDLDDPLAAGLFRLEEGRFPRERGETVVNPAAAARGPGLGDTLTVIRQGEHGDVRFTAEVVGIAHSAAIRGRPVAAALPGSFGPVAEGSGRQWLVGGGPVSWADVRAANEVGVFVASRAVLTDPPPDSALPPGLAVDQGPDDGMVTVLALVVVMVLIEVVLLAGPAFAVRAKAQAHALALVAASGGTPAQARRTVLASGVVVGLVGGLVGTLVGVGVGAIGAPVAQRFQGEWFGPFEVPWLLLGVVAGFGFASAVLAAVVPAISASRQDVVTVLAGRRGEGRPSARSPLVGLVLIGAGIGGSLLGVAGADTSPVLVGGSAIVSVLGMILLVPIVVVTVSRLAAGLPLALRFAARDAARHRTRTVPAVAAVGGTVAGVVALSIAVSSQAAADEERYQPQLRHGYGAVAVGADPDLAAIRATLAEEVPASAIEPIRGVVQETDGGWVELALEARGEPITFSSWGTLGTPYLVGTRIPPALGLSAAEEDRAEAVLAEGGAVVLRNRDLHGPEELDALTVEVVSYDEESGEERPGRSVEVPAAVVTPAEPTFAVAVVLAPSVVRELHLGMATTALTVPPGLTSAQVADVNERLAKLRGAGGELYVERGHQPDGEERVIQLVLAALGAVLMLGGTITATFLALSDARPDLATMAAVGARPRTRRRIAASYALVVGVVGAVLGASVGFIPGVAISKPLTRQADLSGAVLDVPWLLIALVVVGLPLLSAGVVGACARSRLPLAARIE